MSIQAMEDALGVLTKTPHIRAYLEEQDPMALKQANDALAGKDGLVSIRWEQADVSPHELIEMAAHILDHSELYLLEDSVGNGFFLATDEHGLKHWYVVNFLASLEPADQVLCMECRDPIEPLTSIIQDEYGAPWHKECYEQREPDE